MNAYLGFILVPLILSNVLHMFIVKRGLLPALCRPLSEPLFGKNKTWRGLITVPLLNGATLMLLCVFFPRFALPEAFVLGATLGLAYMLSELPNSWLKRRAGIAPGGEAETHAWFFHLLDKTDSSLGVSLASFVLFDFSISETILLFAAASLTHVFFSWVLVVAGVKKSF